MKMRNRLAILLLASAVAGCTTPQVDDPSRGVKAANQPVVTRSDFAVDLSAPDGTLSPAEQARLDGWYGSLGLGYGDAVYIDGPYAESARADVARVTGKYGLLVSRGYPVTAGSIQPGAVRVVVSRTRASVPGCPNWDRPASPDFENRQMSNYGCSIGSNMAAMVAHPGDLEYGREGAVLIDGLTSSKAIQSYRAAKPTGEGGLKEINTKKGGN
jgi:pilus assembly protein CpaD